MKDITREIFEIWMKAIVFQTVAFEEFSSEGKEYQGWKKVKA